jgi:DNA anti-recombination protein RmuC
VESIRVIAEENRAEVNFELVERLAEREERDRTYFGRLRREREEKLQDPRDVLLDGLRQQLKRVR